MQRKMLGEMVILRIVFCLMIVMFHALCPYGIWKEHVAGIGYVSAYESFARGLAFLHIPGFVFISGYLFGYAAKFKTDALELKLCIVKKARRLLLPSMLFSAVYLCLYATRPVSCSKFLYETINGYAHLWFLPMLFWCFVITCVLTHFRLSGRVAVVTALCFVVAILPWPSLPLQISQSFHYYFFFFLGFGLQYGYFQFLKPFRASNRRIACGLCLTAVTFVLSALCVRLIDMPDNVVIGGGGKLLIMRVIVKGLEKLFHLVCSAAAVPTAYWIACRFCSRGEVSKKIIELSNNCMGVYIFQQFILIALYYHTGLPRLCGSYALPWVGFALTVPLSFAGTYLMRKTRWGRFLVG